MEKTKSITTDFSSEIKHNNLDIKYNDLEKFRALAIELANKLTRDENNYKYPICFDFDGTITINNIYPETGTLRSGIVFCIQLLYRLNYPIIINTCRSTGSSDQNEAFIKMIKTLHGENIPYDNINKSIDFQTGKPYGVLYIDDSTLDWDNNITGYELLIKIINYIDNKYKI